MHRAQTASRSHRRCPRRRAHRPRALPHGRASGGHIGPWGPTGPVRSLTLFPPAISLASTSLHGLFQPRAFHSTADNHPFVNFLSTGRPLKQLYRALHRFYRPGLLARQLTTASFHIVVLFSAVSSLFPAARTRYYAPSRSESYLFVLSSSQAQFDPIEYASS